MGILEGIKVPTSNTLAVSAGACIVGGIIGGLAVKKVISSRAVADTPPEKWVKVGELKELRIYPVKGLPGILVKEAVLANLGLKGVGDSPLLRDRVFVIVNPQRKAFSQGKFPMLALTRVQIEGNKLHLSHVNDPNLDITVQIPTIAKDASSTKVVTLYGENVRGVDCGDEVAEWLTKITGTPDLRMLYHVEERTQRGPVKRNLRFPTYRGKSDAGAFQDETSYMLMTDESVAALNAHLEKPASHDNFRPTIVLSGVSEPFAEDFWGYIKIGKQDNAPIMKTSLPCLRCNMTTVDPETGTFRTDGEPLRTLYKLKRPVGDEKVTKLVSKSAVMGAHFGVFQGEGSIIRVGDPVYAAVM